MTTSVGAGAAHAERFIIVCRPYHSEIYPEQFHFMEIGHVVSQV